MKSLFLLMFCLSSLTACDSKNSEDEKQTTNPKNSNKNATADAVLAPDNIEDSREATLLYKSTKKSLYKIVEINNVKFKTAETPIKTGHKVINTMTNQSGLVTGSFVIILSNAQKPSSNISENFSIKKIADKTFEVTPIEENIDLLYIYDVLKRSKDIIQVEMSIHYVGLNEPETF